MAKILVVFYSMYGHVYQLAQAVADGAASVDGVDVTLKRVEELVPAEALEASGADKAQAAFAHVPVATPAELPEYDAIIVGAPTRFGTVAAQMRNFWDQTGKLWVEGKLIGKLGSVFCATGTQHGGQETTITSMFSTFLHHGMLIAGLPYSEQRLMAMGEITGGGPNGAGTLSNVDGSRTPSENELAIARSQGAHIAALAKKLAG
jgi:NAD(P)H:quinone oxidoreductase type IV